MRLVFVALYGRKTTDLWRISVSSPRCVFWGQQKSLAFFNLACLPAAPLLLACLCQPLPPPPCEEWFLHIMYTSKAPSPRGFQPFYAFYTWGVANRDGHGGPLSIGIYN